MDFFWKWNIYIKIINFCRTTNRLHCSYFTELKKNRSLSSSFYFFYTSAARKSSPKCWFVSTRQRNYTKLYFENQSFRKISPDPGINWQAVMFLYFYNWVNWKISHFKVQKSKNKISYSFVCQLWQCGKKNTDTGLGQIMNFRLVNVTWKA